jgi:hypothetical protein
LNEHPHVQAFEKTQCSLLFHYLHRSVPDVAVFDVTVTHGAHLPSILHPQLALLGLELTFF